MLFFLEPINLTLSPSDKWNTRLYKSTVNWAESFLSRGRKIYCVNVSKESFKTTFHWSEGSQKTFRERSFISKVFLIALYVSGIFPVLAFGLKLYQRSQLNTEIWLAKGITLTQEIDSAVLENTEPTKLNFEKVVFRSSHQLLKYHLESAAKELDFTNIDEVWKTAAFNLLNEAELVPKDDKSCKASLSWDHVLDKDVFLASTAIDPCDIKAKMNDLVSTDKTHLKLMLQYQPDSSVPTESVGILDLLKEHIKSIAVHLGKTNPRFEFLKPNVIIYKPPTISNANFSQDVELAEDVLEIIKQRFLEVKKMDTITFSYANLSVNEEQASKLVALSMLLKCVIKPDKKLLILSPKVALDFNFTLETFKRNELTSRDLFEDSQVIFEAYDLALWIKENKELTESWLDHIKKNNVQSPEIPHTQKRNLTVLSGFIRKRYFPPLMKEKICSLKPPIKLREKKDHEFYSNDYRSFFEIFKNDATLGNCVLNAVLMEQNVTAAGKKIESSFELRQAVVAYMEERKIITSSEPQEESKLEKPKTKNKSELDLYENETEQSLLKRRCREFSKEKGDGEQENYVTHIEYVALSELFQRPIFIFRAEDYFKRDFQTGAPIPHARIGSTFQKKKPIYLVFEKGEGAHCRLMKPKELNLLNRSFFRAQVIWKSIFGA